MLDGIVTVILATTFLSPVLQGYYYTFYSLLMIQSFLEMGFGMVFIQFAVHEWAFLRLTEGGRIEGEQIHKARLADALKLAGKWYVGLAISFWALASFGGIWFLSQRSGGRIAYVSPWLLLVATSGLMIILTGYRNYLEGTNRVKKSYEVLLKATIPSSLAMWISLASGAGLYSPAIAGFVMASGVFLQSSSDWKTISEILHFSTGEKAIRWATEFWPFQWRIALSWISGFLMYQSFVPISFKLMGPEPAGKIGATMQLFQGANSTSQVWLYASSPKFGMAVARNEFSTARKLISSITVRSVITASVVGTLAVLLYLIAWQSGVKQAARFAGPLGVGVVMLAALLLQPIAVETYAVRAQKKEPFLVNSLVTALLMGTANYLVAKTGNVDELLLSFLIIVPGVSGMWCHLIFRRYFPNLVVTPK